MKKKRKAATAKKNILFGGRRMRPCEYCGAPLTRDKATVDHVKPIGLGGYDRIKNCVIACSPCNQRKACMTREQFLNLVRSERAP